MNKQAHTPGPWGYESTSGAIFYADGDVEPVIAGINQDLVSEAQADADGRLIAAAPDLLAVVIRAQRLYHKELFHLLPSKEAKAVLADMAAALVKAEG